MARMVNASTTNRISGAGPLIRAGGLVVLCAGLVACATGPSGRLSKYAVSQQDYDQAHRKGQRPSTSSRSKRAPTLGDQTLGRYKVGSPYQVGGVWYTPAEQPNYEETGLASWYGDAFHAKSTANGELFDMSALTAAHKTLPLPSIVEVTNLDNGRRLKVRVNDRGPFVGGRILDLSRAAAGELGFAQAGLARVRVRYVGPAPLGGPGGGGLRLAAAPVPQVSRPVTVQPPLASSNRYEVVVGAFANLSSAQNLVDRVAPAGVAMVKPVQRDGVTLYRVVVSAIADETHALAVREQMLAFGLGDARIVYPN